ncbi:MAG: hypothetical protein ACR2M0_03640 [Chloroflexia bacterium]
MLTLALVTEAAYVFGFLLPYPLAGNYTHPLLDLNRLSGHTPASANYFAVTWMVCFAALLIAYSRCPRRPTRGYWLVLGGSALVFNLTLLLMYPTGAADIFDQIFQARELAVYGKNPLLYAPGSPAFAADPFLAYIGESWKDSPSPYGPVWQLLTAGTALLAGDDLWRALIFFKGLVVLAYAGTCFGVYATLRLVRPDWATRGLLFVAWNPLLIWEAAGNGHNDIVMALFTVLCFYCLARGGRFLLFAPGVLALAVLSKYVSLLLLPAVLIAVWQMLRPAAGTPFLPRAPWNRAALTVVIGLLGFVVVAVLLYIPFWYGFDTIRSLLNRDLFTASLPNSVKDVLAAGPFNLGEQAARELVHNLSNAIVVVWVVSSMALLLVTTRPGDRDGILRATFRTTYGIFFVYLVFGTLWFQPWYQTWIIALTPLTTQTSRVKRTLVMNAGGVANYFVWDYLVLWNNSWGNVIQWTSALSVNMPLLLYTGYQLLVPDPADSDELAPALDEPAPALKEAPAYDTA